MHLINTSAYHTATLRRIFTTTIRALNAEYTVVPARTRKFDARICVEEGRTRLHWEWEEGARAATLHLRLPKLTGAEFIPLLRQQHGGAATTSNVAHTTLESEQVAFIAQQVANSFFGWRHHDPLRLNLSVRSALVRAKIPQYVPLRVRKPPKEEEPRDIVAERYKRVLELETRWKTKRKLAETKLKKLRLKRRHYEKQLAKRSTTKEV